MADLLDYLRWRGDIPFTQVPLGEVDALLLSYLSYMPFEGIVPSDLTQPGVTLGEAAHTLMVCSEAEDFKLAYSKKDDRRLLPLVEQSPRFAGVRLAGFVNHVDCEAEEQFAALCFLLEGGGTFVAFRGTDDTVIGWKENFNMSFTQQVPAQRDAVRYLEGIAAALPGPLIVGGHSKGGNLAVYAGVFAEPSVCARVQAIYNFDGPGFNEETIALPQFNRADMPPIATFVPQGAIVGILLWHSEPFTVVRSDTVSGIFQHNPYTWQLMGGRFETVSERTSPSFLADDTIKGWLASLDPVLRERIIDGIFSVLLASEGKKVCELFEWKNAMIVLRAAADVDAPTRAALEEAFNRLAASFRRSLPEWVERATVGWRRRAAGELRDADAPAALPTGKDAAQPAG